MNGKSYVGQSRNVNRRFKEHLRASEDVVLHRAIKKYGADNFTLTIIDPQVEDYNEREQFWIEHLKTLAPNGYNMTPGGENYPHASGTEHYASRLTNDQVQEIRTLLATTTLTQTEIGDKFHVAQTVVSRINLGIGGYRDIKTNYPIRKNIINDVPAIQSLLIHTKMSFTNIAKIYGTDRTSVAKINRGEAYYDERYTYPLRDCYLKGKLDNEDVLSEIKDLLENSDLTTYEIGQKFGVQRMAIEHINQGKSYIHDNWKYPLRTVARVKKKFSPDEIDNIISLLRNTKMSLRAIARQYGVMHCTIQGINNGTSKAYYRPDITYPIRNRY